MDNNKIIEVSPIRVLGLLTFITCLLSLVGMAIYPSNSNSYTSFWALIVLFSIPAVLYVITCARSVIHGGAKYLIFRNRKILNKPKKEEINEAEREKKLILEKELKRKEKEKYSSPMLKTRWTAMPVLIFFGAGLYVLIIYFSNEKEYVMNGFNTAILIIGALGLLVVWALSIEDKWQKIRAIKYEIHRENPNYKFYDGYDDNFIYTDSTFSYLFFRFGKVLAYLLSIAGMAIVAGILISLISGMSISPTTIIIFLLIMIYFEVRRRNSNNY
ncbi:MAG: hypothetical protein QG583_19 [Patescibacteria group bacterium]|nr:hypothetical protein [Patescibacteria group bacterium]